MMSTRSRNKLVCGVGINDADYVVAKKINGAFVSCEFYSVWRNMISRCYSKTWQAKQQTYKGCSVCKEWLTFSNFKKWMEKQAWKGKELDKDLIVFGNKIYMPETCSFVDSRTNLFVIDSFAARGDWPIGVFYNKKTGKFKSACKNQFTGKRESLGTFTSPEDAHLAWKKRKHELACQLADLQADDRVAAALRIRYL